MPPTWGALEWPFWAPLVSDDWWSVGGPAWACATKRVSSKPLPGEVVGKVVGSIDVLDAFKALNPVVAAAREYGEISQVEQSRRAAIAAAESVQVSRLQAAENTLRMYFDRRAIRSWFTQSCAESWSSRSRPPLSGLEDFGKFWADFGTEENPLEL